MAQIYNSYGGVLTTPFIIDKFYPNRKALDEAVDTDSIMIGRYVCIRYCNEVYDSETIKKLQSYVIPFEENWKINKNEEYEHLSENEKTYIDNYLIDKQYYLCEVKSASDFFSYNQTIWKKELKEKIYEHTTPLLDDNGETIIVSSSESYVLEYVPISNLSVTYTPLSSGSDGVGQTTEGCGEIFNIIVDENDENNNINVASSSYSHAEGRLVKAIGTSAHAEGNRTVAHGNSSHVEGQETLALGTASHSEAIRNIALGNGAHAEGFSQYEPEYVEALINDMRDDGIATIVLEDEEEIKIDVTNGEEWIGWDNEFKNWGDTSIDINNFIDSNRNKALTAIWRHEIGKNENGSFNIAIGQGSHVEGTNNYAVGDGTHVEGQNNYVNGNASHAEGYFTEILAPKAHAEGERTYVELQGGHAEGYQTKTLGEYAHAEGGNTEAGGQYSHAEGSNTKANKAAAHSEGENTEAFGQGSHAEGYFTFAGENYSHTEGNYTIATGANAHAEGNRTFEINDESNEPIFKASGASGNSSHSEGIDTSASADAAHAEGIETIAAGRASHASGIGTNAQGVAQTVIGKYNSEDLTSLFIVGNGENDEVRRNAFVVDEDGIAHIPQTGNIDTAITNKYYVDNEIQTRINSITTTAMGIETIGAEDKGQLVIGQYNEGDAEAAFIIGQGIGPAVIESEENEEAIDNPDETTPTIETVRKNIFIVKKNAALIHGNDPSDSADKTQYNIADGVGAHAEGLHTYAKGVQAHSEGKDTSAYSNFSHAEGIGTRTGSDDTPTEENGLGSHAEGYNTVAIGDYAHAEGYQTQAQANGAHAEGCSTVAIGNYSHAEGYQTQAKTNGAHTEGRETEAEGSYSHAEGQNTKAGGNYSHAEGYDTEVLKDFSHAHAEGYKTKAQANYSHAEGNGAITSGTSSHAEGQETKASGSGAHAEGLQTEASGKNSHAEGYDTLASGGYSHAEGGHTKATKNYAHAEGLWAEASGDYSHAEGEYSKASHIASHAQGGYTETGADYQAVVGKFNVIDNKALFLVGNGTSNNRSNGFAVYDKDQTTLAKIGNTITVYKDTNSTLMNVGNVLTVNNDGSAFLTAMNHNANSIVTRVPYTKTTQLENDYSNEVLSLQNWKQVPKAIQRPTSDSKINKNTIYQDGTTKCFVLLDWAAMLNNIYVGMPVSFSLPSSALKSDGSNSKLSICYYIEAGANDTGNNVITINSKKYKEYKTNYATGTTVTSGKPEHLTNQGGYVFAKYSPYFAQLEESQRTDGNGTIKLRRKYFYRSSVDSSAAGGTWEVTSWKTITLT